MRADPGDGEVAIDGATPAAGAAALGPIDGQLDELLATLDASASA